MTSPFPTEFPCPSCMPEGPPGVCPLCRGAKTFYITEITQDMDMCQGLTVSLRCTARAPQLDSLLRERDYIDRTVLSGPVLKSIPNVTPSTEEEPIDPRTDAVWDF